MPMPTSASSMQYARCLPQVKKTFINKIVRVSRFYRHFHFCTIFLFTIFDVIFLTSNATIQSIAIRTILRNEIQFLHQNLNYQNKKKIIGIWHLVLLILMHSAGQCVCVCVYAQSSQALTFKCLGNTYEYFTYFTINYYFVLHTPDDAMVIH